MYIFGGYSYGAAPDSGLTKSAAKERMPAVEDTVREAASPWAQWRQYAAATPSGDALTAERLYNPAGPFLDWEMGLGMPFAGTYAPPIGLTAGFGGAG
jgi:hypothetical protein